MLPRVRAWSSLAAMAELIAAHVALIDSREWSVGVAAGQKLLRQLLSLLDSQNDWAAVLLSPEAGMMEAMRADGMAVVHDGRVVPRGSTPTEADVLRLVDWLEGRRTSLFVTNWLGGEEPAFAELAATASGLITLRMPQTDCDWLLWFRPELATTVVWAGDPRKGLVQESGGQRLTPRKSFAAWVEAVRGKSRLWTIAEQAIAGEAVRTNLADILASWQRRQIQGLQTFQGILFEQVNDAVVVADAEGKVTFWNDAAARLYGWTRGEMLGSLLEQAGELGQVLVMSHTQGEFLGEQAALRKDGNPDLDPLAWANTPRRPRRSGGFRGDRAGHQRTQKERGRTATDADGRDQHARRRHDHRGRTVGGTRPANPVRQPGLSPDDRL